MSAGAEGPWWAWGEPFELPGGEYMDVVCCVCEEGAVKWARRQWRPAMGEDRRSREECLADFEAVHWATRCEPPRLVREDAEGEGGDEAVNVFEVQREAQVALGQLARGEGDGVARVRAMLEGLVRAGEMARRVLEVQP